MKFRPWTLVLLTSILMLFQGCSEKEEPVNEFEVITQYMVENDLDLPNLLTDWITTSKTVFDNGPENYFIVDLRGSDIKPANGTIDFEDGHIPGAHLVTLSGVVEYVKANNTDDLPVVVVCYSGQTAGHAAMALRLSGVPAKILKFGMSSWHKDFDVWSGNVGNTALDYSEGWDMTTSIPAFPDFDPPVLTTGYDEGADILSERIKTMLSNGFKGLNNSEVLANYNDYNVLNYWDASDWEHYGHITGAYQVTPCNSTTGDPGDLHIDGNGLKMIDPNKPNVIYCWTGQTASMVTAWLNVLGYEAYVLKFSANGMIYDNLESHKWSESACMNFDYQTGP